MDDWMFSSFKNWVGSASLLLFEIVNVHRCSRNECNKWKTDILTSSLIYGVTMAKNWILPQLKLFIIFGVGG